MKLIISALIIIFLVSCNCHSVSNGVVVKKYVEPSSGSGKTHHYTSYHIVISNGQKQSDYDIPEPFYGKVSVGETIDFREHD